jgi:hypothetical protein
MVKERAVEECRTLSEAYDEGYNQAIDDFKKYMELWANNIEEIRQSAAFFTIHDIRYQAEQLKK